MNRLRLAAIFSDSMVLQRNKRINFWGTADKLTNITVSIAEKTVSGTSDIKGNWQLSFPPMKEGGPFTLVVSDGTNNINLDNIMIGEVWFAGGQSNMQFELSNCKTYKEAISDQAMNNYNIRFYRTPKISYFTDNFEEQERREKWHIAGADTIGGMSAVAYYAAQQLCKSMPDITIGVVECVWGGTSASSWVSDEVLEQNIALHQYKDDYNKATGHLTIEEHKKLYQEYIDYNTEWNKKAEDLKKNNPDITWNQIVNTLGEHRWSPPLGPFSQHAPCALYKTMFSRVCRYTIRGVWYYQGESDTHKPQIYDIMFTSLIQKWRNDFNDNKLPFIFVQLPMYTEENQPDYKNWAQLRETQNKVFDTVKNTGMVIALDQGEFNEIHPTEKIYVGCRLGNMTLEMVYGKYTNSYAPMYKDYFIDDNRFIISFENAENGFVCTSAPIAGFEIAGKDRIFTNAKAEISEDTIIVFSEEIDSPCYVRYNYTNYGEVNLFGKNGIPVAPFRTSAHDFK